MRPCDCDNEPADIPTCDMATPTVRKSLEETSSIFSFPKKSSSECSAQQAQYCAISSDHTLCKYCQLDARCTAHGQICSHELTPSDRDAILAAHNALRSRVASGQETRGDPGPQPSATNMFRMKWSAELAKIAQGWADQCSDSPPHDTMARESFAYAYSSKKPFLTCCLI